MSTTLKPLWTSVIYLIQLIFRYHKLFCHANYEQEEYLMTERDGIDINMNI